MQDFNYIFSFSPKTLILEQEIYKTTWENKFPKKASPAAIASSSMSLKRCESSLGSEQSIEQKSLSRQKSIRTNLKSLKERKTLNLSYLFILPLNFL